MINNLVEAFKFIADGNLKAEPTVKLNLIEKILFWVVAILLSPVFAILGLVKTLVLACKLTFK